MLLRRITAVVLASIMLAVSFSATMAKASAEPGTSPSITFSQHSETTGRPCHRAVLPGAPSACPLLAFTVTAIPDDEDAHIRPPSQVRDVCWNRLSASRAAQCQATSVYRPPRTLT